jgi:hypothetical protein
MREGASASRRRRDRKGARGLQRRDARGASPSAVASAWGVVAKIPPALTRTQEHMRVRSGGGIQDRQRLGRQPRPCPLPTVSTARCIVYLCLAHALASTLACLPLPALLYKLYKSEGSDREAGEACSSDISTASRTVLLSVGDEEHEWRGDEIEERR